MYGTQTQFSEIFLWQEFENDVKMYGTQTNLEKEKQSSMFENNVKAFAESSNCLSYCIYRI